jgi:hypothetical protein
VDAMLARTPSSEVGTRAPRDPVVTLLREVAKRSAIRELRVRKGDDLIVWRRAT